MAGKNWEGNVNVDWRFWGLGATVAIQLGFYSGIGVQLGPVGFYLGYWHEVL